MKSCEKKPEAKHDRTDCTDYQTTDQRKPTVLQEVWSNRRVVFNDSNYRVNYRGIPLDVELLPGEQQRVCLGREWIKIDQSNVALRNSNSKLKF